jgi:hypothetical protein
MKRVALVYILTVLFSCAVIHAQTTTRATLQFGHDWWMSVGVGERHGFLNGYLDCKFPKPDASAKGYGLSVRDLSSRIDAFYAGHKDSDLSVLQLMDKIDGPEQPPPSLPGAEVYTNLHGYYDGLWWTGAFGGEQPGYVEGYLVCLGHPVTKPAAQRLADAISAWYREYPSKEDRAIAYVLEGILKAKKDTHRREKSAPR